MPSEIKCPNCSYVFNADKQLEAELEIKYKEELQQKLKASHAEMDIARKQLEEAQAQFEEKKKRENEIFQERMTAEKQKMQMQLGETIRKELTGDFENRIKLMESQQKDADEKLAGFRKKELEYLQLQKALKEKEENLEIDLEKRMQKERSLMQEQLRKQEAERAQLKDNETQLRIKELETQLEAQKKLADEMKRKAEQGSMQLQGEAQELLLEETLRNNFPFDVIDEVAKGATGADCILHVRTPFGHEAGSIIYESKNTKGWNNDWVTKLKTDMRATGADVAILVSKILPKEMSQFGERDGIWICTFQEVIGVSAIIRNSILKVHEAQRSQENKGEKMQMLYEYLTGNEFRGQVEAIMEGFMSMKQGIARERVQMEKLWKEREKQLEKVLLNTSGMYGSVKGIAGASVGNIALLEDDTGEED